VSREVGSAEVDRGGERIKKDEKVMGFCNWFGKEGEDYSE